MFKNLNIKNKIILMPVIAGVVFLLFVFVLLWQNSQNKALAEKIKNVYYPGLALNNDLENQFGQIQRDLQDAVATADTTDLVMIQIDCDQFLKKLKKSNKKYEMMDSSYRQLIIVFKSYYPIALDAAKSMIIGDTDEDLVNKLEVMTEKYNTIKTSLESNTQRYTSLIDTGFESSEQSNQFLISLVMSATFLGFIILGWISTILIRSILRPLGEVVELANEVGSGNFDVEIKDLTQDEIGVLKEAFSSMVIEINQLIRAKDNAFKDISTANKMLEQSSEELEKTNIELSDHKEHLEERVGERTEELQSANKKLEQEIKIRKKIEKAIRKNEQDFVNLFNQIPDMIFVMDKETKYFLDCNKAVTDLYGYTNEEIKKLTPYALHPKEEHNLLKEKIDQRSNGQEYLHITKEGKIVEIEITSDDLIYQDRPAWLSIARDVTEKNRSKKIQEILFQISQAVSTTDNLEELLKLTHQKLSRIIDTKNFYVSLYDAETDLYSFPYYVDEFDSEESYPQRLPNSLTDYVRTTGLPQLFDEKKKSKLMSKGILAIKGTLSKSWLGVPLKTPEGTIGVVAVQSYTDESAYNLKDLELLSFVSDNIVSGIVRKWAENQQQELMKKIESANEELKSFAYIVSHDLKAPLRAIGSLGDWLATDYGDKLDEAGIELINLLLSRTKRMHKLIEGILQYSRVGRVNEEKVEVNLNTSVNNVIQLISPPDSYKIKIEELPTVWVEKTRIEQVLQNLLTNAIKYMDKPEGEIKIGCASENGFWEISVADNGPGIDEKYFEKVFQIFQTLNARDDFESTGVGLSLVKKIIEMYGGKISVESQIGKGSTFIFTLPKDLQKSGE